MCPKFKDKLRTSRGWPSLKSLENCNQIRVKNVETFPLAQGNSVDVFIDYLSAGYL